MEPPHTPAPYLKINQPRSLQVVFFFCGVSVASTPRRAILPTRSHTPSVKFAVNHKKHIKKMNKKREKSETKIPQRVEEGGEIGGTRWWGLFEHNLITGSFSFI